MSAFERTLKYHLVTYFICHGARQPKSLVKRRHDRPGDAGELVAGHGGGRPRGNDVSRRHVVEQQFAVEVEVAHVAVERRELDAARARLAEDDRVNVQGEVTARQHRYTHTSIKR